MTRSDAEIRQASKGIDELLDSMGVGKPEPSASFASSAGKMRPEHFPKLPQGIHGGALTAIVASVAVVGGSIYLLARHHAKSSERWTERVDAQASVRHR
jgi:hypothetical protein